MPPLLEELAKDIDGEIVADEKTISEYSSDASPFTIRPQVVIYPKTTHDVQKIVSFGKIYKIPITPRGRGKGEKGGCLSEGIILDMNRYFDKLGKLTLQEAKLTVQSGALYKNCVKRLSEWGYVLPFVDHVEDMTIGAMVATHYKSSSSLSSGGISDWIESLRVILDDGKEYLIDGNVSPYGRLLEIYGGTLACLKEEADIIFSGHVGVSHQAMGYDVFTTQVSPKMLMDFILGSEGTLGIITEITLRLDTKKEYVEGLAISLSSLNEISPLIKTILATKPISFSGFDAKTLTLSSSKTSLIQSRHKNDVFTLFAVYGGSISSVSRTITQVTKTLQTYSGNKFTCNENEIKNYNEILFTQKTDLESYAGELLKSVSICNDVVFPSDSLSVAIKELQSVCEDVGTIYSTTINAGTGVIRIETLFDITRKEISNTLNEMLSQVAHIVKWYRGAITYSYGDGIINTPLLPVIYGAPLANTLRKIKKVWDPNNIFNPGKKTNIDMSYLKKHI